MMTWDFLISFLVAQRDTVCLSVQMKVKKLNLLHIVSEWKYIDRHNVPGSNSYL